MNDFISFIIHRLSFIKNGCVVQLDRISDFGSEGWGFESLRGHSKGKVTFISDFSLFLLLLFLILYSIEINTSLLFL